MPKKAAKTREKTNNQIEKIRHSLAHLMAYAVREMYPGVKLGIGPVIENGFYYDFDLPAKTLVKENLPDIEKKVSELVAQKIAFKKRIISKKEAKELFKNQPYKLELIKDLPGNSVSIYESGEFIDLCKGPHVKTTAEIPQGSFKLAKIAGAYWRGSEENAMLTRIYGIAFASKEELEAYLKLQEEAEKRDHRKIGAQLDLFSFHDVAPGAPFWHPKGMIIVKELEKWWREEHEKCGYQEISTPILVKKELFETSGHWEYYKENAFLSEVEGQIYMLKPMNCPESTMIYSSKIRSYKDLPLRLSEIGRLHRNELSGVLAGLFRVRQITMDDAHIYCTQERFQEEIANALKLITNFYGVFNFLPEFRLATRPEEYMGDAKLWSKAENALEYALNSNKLKYTLKPKDGAFYGPKIDVHITDALGRSWQLGTVQLDFQIPLRFNLSYTDAQGKKRCPIMLHRAIFGSFERFIGILLEHLGGNLPLWLAPEQIWIIPISSAHQNYAKEIKKVLQDANFRIVLKDENETISKKIREGELQKIPYLLVVGSKEIANKTISLRSREKGNIGEMTINKFLEKAEKEFKDKK